MPKDTIDQIRSRALELNRNQRQGQPPTPPNTGQTSLSTLLSDPGATWQFSSGGTGGASIVKSPNVSSGGAAIKIEHNGLTTNSERCAKFMDEFFQRAQGPQPFAAPRAKVYTKNDFDSDPSLAPLLDQRLDAQKVGLSQNRSDKVDGHKQNLADLTATGGHSVFVMEFGQGEQITRLPTHEKEALLRSDAFAQSIGRAMAPSIALGLKDHLGTTTGNPSNLMYDPDSGSLSVIDYDAGAPGNVKGHDLVGASNYSPQSIQDMRTYLDKVTQSPKAFEAAINDMVNNPDHDSPFAAVYKSFTRKGSAAGEFLFTPGEENACQDLTPAEKRKFATNLLKGAIDGLDYMQQNQQALEQAAQLTHEVAQDGTKLEHFYDQKRMDQFKQEIQKVDVHGLRNKMDGLMQKQAQAEKAQLDKYQKLQDKLTSTERSIDRIENHPSRGDKLKSLLTRKDHHPVDDLRRKKQDIENQLASMGDLPKRMEFQNKMEQGQVNPPQQQVGVNQNPGRTQLTQARKGGVAGPQHPELLTTDLPPLPQLPTNQPQGNNAPKVQKVPTTGESLRAEKNTLKSPSDNLRNRTGQRAKPRTGDMVQRTDEGQKSTNSVSHRLK